MAKPKPDEINALPFFVIAVSITFAFLSSVFLFPVLSAFARMNIEQLFIVFLIVSVTVSSTIAFVFFSIFLRKN